MLGTQQAIRRSTGFGDYGEFTFTFSGVFTIIDYSKSAISVSAKFQFRIYTCKCIYKKII